MRFAWLLATLLLALPAYRAAQGEPIGPPASRERDATPAVAAPSPPFATNKRSFFIPVTVDRNSRDHQPAEVHLLVSADQGKTWSTYARQSTDATGFQFQARDDGEYWFASRTLDAQGQAKPPGSALQPELRIVIDSTPPKIELDAAVGATGEVKAAWRISDASMAADGVRMEYQSGDAREPAWQNVTLEPTAQKFAGHLLLGSTAWQPLGTSRAIDVRIIARDRAGNMVADTQRVFLPRASQVAAPKIPAWPPRIAPPTTASGSSPSTAGDPFTSRQFPQGNAADTVATPAATPSHAPQTPVSRGTPWPADNKLPAAPATSPSTPAPGDKLAAQPTELPTQPLARMEGAMSPPVTDRVVAQPSSTGGKSSPLIWPSDAARQETPVESPPSAPAAVPMPPDPSALEAIPQPETPLAPRSDVNPTAPTITAAPDRPQLTSSKSFTLDYDIDSVGPSGIRAAELWVTVDGGRVWEKWGDDEDRRSPFEIQVESERTFGFRMVIVANNGLATRSPEPGDAADIWVTVDATKPRAHWLQAGYGQGEHSGQLDLRWEADDEHLSARPVTISFSESPDGPYTVLAAGLPNTGQYYWTIDPRTPRQLYLRLEVRDDAGNVAVDQTAEPVSLEGLSPKGRIRAITPAPLPGTAAPLEGAFRSPLFR
jgi:hypothetical protein